VSQAGRVVIIGDAAHATKPNGGQGGSLSLEDAVTLAIAVKKANAKSDFENAKEILARWDSIRLQRFVQAANAPRGMGMQMGPGDPFAKEGWTKEDDSLFWLYGYDTENFEALL
jgi:2-polyprenyl-6-methoxyphenol hydroxylase-like FAD-dependent oxidoreductase